MLGTNANTIPGQSGVQHLPFSIASILAALLLQLPLFREARSTIG